MLNVNAAVVKFQLNREAVSPPRLFSTVALRQNTDIVLGSDQARYVGHVLRLRTGDQLMLFDGTGGEFAATLGVVAKQQLNLAVGERFCRETR